MLLGDMQAPQRLANNVEKVLQSGIVLLASDLPHLNHCVVIHQRAVGSYVIGIAQRRGIQRPQPLIRRKPFNQ
jgi:hypothetical protein